VHFAQVSAPSESVLLARRLEDEVAQIVILGDIAHPCLDECRINRDCLTSKLICVERDLFNDLFDDRLEPACTDIFIAERNIAWSVHFPVR
jgi:hypothetical protein